jgi:DNA repair protein RadC
MSAGRMGFKDAGKPHYLGHRERLRKRFRDAGRMPSPITN